jgi:hypothetical protein
VHANAQGNLQVVFKVVPFAPPAAGKLADEVKKPVLRQSKDPEPIITNTNREPVVVNDGYTTYFDPNTGHAAFIPKGQEPPKGWLKDKTEPREMFGTYQPGREPRHFVDPTTGKGDWFDVTDPLAPKPPAAWIELKLFPTPAAAMAAK